MSNALKELCSAAHYITGSYGWRHVEAVQAVVDLYAALHHTTNEGVKAAREFGIVLPRPDGESLRESLRVLWAPGAGLSGKDSTLRKITGGTAALNACVCLKRWALHGAAVFVSTPRQYGKRWESRFFGADAPYYRYDPHNGLTLITDEAHHIWEDPMSEADAKLEALKNEQGEGKKVAAHIEAALAAEMRRTPERMVIASGGSPATRETLTEATLPWVWRCGDDEVLTRRDGEGFVTDVKRDGRAWLYWPNRARTVSEARAMHHDRIGDAFGRMARRDYLEHGTAYAEERAYTGPTWRSKVETLQAERDEALHDLANERAAWREKHAPAMEALQAECLHLDRENFDLLRENETLNTENAKLHKQAANHHQAYEMLADLYRALVRSSDTLALDRDRLQAVAIELEQELAVARSTVDTLRAELKSEQHWHEDEKKLRLLWQEKSHGQTEACARLRRGLTNAAAFSVGFGTTLAVGALYWNTLAQWVARVWQHAPSSEGWAVLAVGLALLLPLLRWRKAMPAQFTLEGRTHCPETGWPLEGGIDSAAPGTQSQTWVTLSKALTSRKPYVILSGKALQDAMRDAAEAEALHEEVQDLLCRGVQSGIVTESVAVVENPNRSTATCAEGQPLPTSNRRHPCHLCGAEDSPLVPGYCDDCIVDCTFCGDPTAPPHLSGIKPCCASCVPF